MIERIGDAVDDVTRSTSEGVSNTKVSIMYACKYSCIGEVRIDAAKWTGTRERAVRGGGKKVTVDHEVAKVVGSIEGVDGQSGGVGLESPEYSGNGDLER